MLPVLFLSATLWSQGKTAQTPAHEQAPLVPATKLEAFQPSAGTVVTFGYDPLGSVGNTTADVREIQDSKGATAKGLLVEVSQDEYTKESYFIDADEIPELLKGIDSLMQVTSNPTQFQNFEVRYTTRGGLQITAFNESQTKISYAVRAGRGVTAQNFLSAANMLRLKGLFVTAQQKLASLPAK